MQVPKRSHVWCCFAAIALVSLLLMGCGEEPISSTTEVDSQVWTLSGVVYDGTTKQRLDSVTVEWGNQGDNPTLTTNTDGDYHIQGLTAGDHWVTYARPGYAAVKMMVSAVNDTNFKVWLDQDANIPMYPLTGALSGDIYLFVEDSAGAGTRNQTSTSMPNAIGAKVWFMALSSYNLLESNYSTTVDSQGQVAFTGLPEVIGALVFEDVVLNGVAYSASYASAVNLVTQSAIEAVDYAVDNDFQVKVMSTNVGRGYFTADTITVAFSDSIIEAGAIVSLVGANSGTANLISPIWAADGKSVKIAPVFKLQKNDVYTLMIVGNAGNGKVLNVSNIYVKTPPAVYITSSNVLDENGNPLQNVLRNTTVTVTVSESLAHVDPVDSFSTTISVDGKTVSFVPLFNITSGMAASLDTITGVSGMDELFMVNMGVFGLLAAPQLIYTNLKDANGNAAQNIGQNDTLIFVYSEAIDASQPRSLTAVGAPQLDTMIAGDTLKVFAPQYFVAGSAPTLQPIVITASGVSVQPATALTVNVVPGIALEFTNIVQSDGATGVTNFSLTDSIVFNFTVAIDVAEFNASKLNTEYITMEDERASVNVDFDVAFSNSNMTMTITPSSSLLPKEDNASGYSVAISANLPSVLINDTYAGFAATTFQTVFTISAPGAVQGFAFDTVGNEANYRPDHDVASFGGNAINLKWNEMDSVDNYYIYAIGSQRETTIWQEVATSASTFGTGALFQSATIPAASFNVFDRFGADAVAYNNVISLAIVAENAAGRGTAHSDTLILRDLVAPGDTALASAAPTGSWNAAGTVPGVANVDESGFDNSAGTEPVYLGYILTFAEDMDITTSPTVTIDNTAATDNLAAPTWTWMTRQSGYFLFTVPATEDASGATIDVDITGGMDDSSGNTVQTNAQNQNVTTTQTTLP